MTTETKASETKTVYTFIIGCYNPEIEFTPRERHILKPLSFFADNEIVARAIAMRTAIVGKTCPTCGLPLEFTRDGNPVPSPEQSP